MSFQKYVVVILIFVLIFLTLLNSFSIISSNKIQFLTSNESALFLKEDKDKYVQKMSEVDLYARKSKSASEYIDKAMRCTTSFSDIEKAKLSRCAYKADKFLRSYKYNNTIDCKEIAKIQWKFAITQKSGSYEYEEGLPHTRSDVIFLSKYTINDEIAKSTDDNVLTSTLIHEKVHIFQRYNDKVMSDMIKKTHTVVDVQDKELLKLKRCNPDTDDKNYYDNIHKEVMLFVYTSSTPKGINDISSKKYAVEHPYETMAYEIANEYTKKTLIELTRFI